jgi:hypothetical protein
LRDGLTSGLTACPRYCSICQPIRRRHVAVDHLSPAPIDSTCMAPKRHDSQNPGGGRWEEIKAPAGQKQIHCLAGRGEPPHCRVDRGVTRSIHWTATRSNLSMGPPTPIRQYIRSPVLISDLSGDCANQLCRHIARREIRRFIGAGLSLPADPGTRVDGAQLDPGSFLVRVGTGRGHPLADYGITSTTAPLPRVLLQVLSVRDRRPSWEDLLRV